MDVVANKLRTFLGYTWVMVVSAFLSALGGILAAYQVFGLRTIGFSISLAAILALLSALIYSIRIHQENAAFRRLPALLHRVNHGYRNTLCELFRDDKTVPREEDLRRAERKTLESVCQKIAAIFSALTHVPCTVTIKFIYTADDGAAVCRTLVRSETNCQRDEGRPEIFALADGENTAFTRCMEYEPGKTSHYFGADLVKEKEAGRYRNQRTNWENFYVSAIVVPIRFVDIAKVGHPGASNHIGFLAVDTTSTNRLNGTYHVELLASFADQVYNFMCLMRGMYGVPRAPQAGGGANV